MGPGVITSRTLASMMSCLLLVVDSVSCPSRYLGQADLNSVSLGPVLRGPATPPDLRPAEQAVEGAADLLGQRACGIGLTTFHRTTPSLSMMNVPRVARPRSESNTPYSVATSPCGQKSDSRPNWKCSASAQARWAKVESTETVSSSTSSRLTSGNSSRMAHSSPVHTPLNASG